MGVPNLIIIFLLGPVRTLFSCSEITYCLNVYTFPRVLFLSYKDKVSRRPYGVLEIQ